MNADAQKTILSRQPHSFEERVGRHVFDGLNALSLRTFQINVGRWCNQACRHCHVDASPARTEAMDRQTAELCVEVLTRLPAVETVDITGGAPEGNPQFRYLVKESRKLGKRVMDRCNLTILEEPGFEEMHVFLAEHEVEVVASLPHFAAERTDGQRGKGVFDRSITALGKLNAEGYGTRLPLNLVYNPAGVYLSGSQQQLEREFREQLRDRYGIVFSQLFCLNNMPINRYLDALLRAGKLDAYLERLVQAFNPETLPGLMCRHMVSVGYDGSLFDCDFNQMLEMTATPFSHLRDLAEAPGNGSMGDFTRRRIRTSTHCFGCTAGAGSSCGGEVVGELVSVEPA